MDKKPQIYEDTRENFFVLLGGFFYPLGSQDTSDGYELVRDNSGSIGFVAGNQFISLKPISNSNKKTIAQDIFTGCIVPLAVAIIGAAATLLAGSQLPATTICSSLGSVLSGSPFCNTVVNIGNISGVLTATPSVVATLTAVPSITPTPTLPASMRQSITVPAAFDESLDTFPVTFPCPTSGRYKVTVEDGAYSGWPNAEVVEGYGVNPGGQWRTFILIYVDKTYNEIWIESKLGSPRLLLQPFLFDKDTHSVGLLEDIDNSSREQAISDGRGQITIVNCDEGQEMQFIAFDEKGQYSDNIGGVILSIEKESQN